MFHRVQFKEIIAEKISQFIFSFMGMFVLFVMSSVFIFIGLESWPAFERFGFSFITGLSWDVSEEVFGAASMIVGSLIVTFIAFIFALPLSLSAAIISSEFIPERWRWLPKMLMEILAGIPSVIYGLIGIVLLVPWIQNSFSLLTGRTLVSAGLILGFMILPTLMTFIEDSLRSVSRDIREAARGLGLSKIETILFAVFPKAKSGIAAALLLGIGRALGETVAVMLLVGSVDKIPSPLYQWLLPGQTLTSKIGREAAESAIGSIQYHSLFALGGLLLLAVFFLSLIAKKYIARNYLESKI